MKPTILLASTSKYRAGLLSQLGLPFSTIDPAVAEPLIALESPPDRANRLAREKAIAGARARAHSHEQSAHSYKKIAHRDKPNIKTIIIGSDQVAHLNQQILSKPGNFDRAFEQLRICSGQWVTFSVGISLCNLAGDVIAAGLDQYAIQYRELSDQQIQRYLNHDQPFDCAGSIKAESLGVALFAETRGKDINTLYGLPLILLTDLLAEVGISVL